MNQKTIIKSDSYACLLNEAHQHGLGEIYTQIIIFPQENKNKALVWARITLSKGSFSALAEADTLEEAEHKAKYIALSEALNKVGETKEEKLAETPSPEKEQPSAPSQESKENQSSQGSAESQESFEPMSEAQRRYLLRLLADQGFKGNPAYEKLKSMFGVSSLKEVSKIQASQKIQEMLNSQESAQSIPGGKKYE